MWRIPRSAAPIAPRSTRPLPCGWNSSPVSATTRPSCWLSRLVRGRISVAHDNAHDALQEATAMITYATSSGNAELLYAGLALKARCPHAEHLDTDALAACERYLTRWHDAGGMVNRAIELAELTPVLVTAGRHQDIRDAALPLPQNSR